MAVSILLKELPLQNEKRCDPPKNGTVSDHLKVQKAPFIFYRNEGYK